MEDKQMGVLTLMYGMMASNNPFPNIMDLMDDSLEMGSGIVRTGDEDVVVFTTGCREVQWGYRNESEFDWGLSLCASIGLKYDQLIDDGTEKLKTAVDLCRWVFGLNDRTDNRNIHVLGANIVGGQDHGDVDI